MQKMDTQITDGRAELRISVEPVGDPVHVVVAGPVAGQLANIIPRDALGPIGHGFAIWPSCQLQASAQIGDNTGTSFSVNGARVNFNSFYLDGSYNTSFFRGGGNIVPAPDALPGLEPLALDAAARLGRSTAVLRLPPTADADKARAALKIAQPYSIHESV